MCKLSHHVTPVVVALLCVVHSSSQRSTPDSTDYVAAVVEYHPELSVDATTTFFKNVHNYIRLIKEVANSSNNADIIVFPEGSLTTLDYKVPTLVPLASDNIVPCTDTSGLYENLRLLSCAARDNQIYVVVNHSERFYCPKGTKSEYNEPCPDSGLLDYNCNVAFDRNGAVIAKYRKFTLYGKEGSTVSPPIPDLVTFDTDFGVTFGTFICFDILFEEAIHLVQEKNITDIIYPTAWFSELPFLTAVQVQAAWSYAMDVNLLVSGYNTPAKGNGGSGIYEGRRGPVWTIMPNENTTKLFIYAVQKKNKIVVKEKPRKQTTNARSKLVSRSHAIDGMRITVEDLSVYTTQLLDSGTTGEIFLCNNNFCCTFEVSGLISSDHEEGERYYNRIVVFDGVRSVYGKATIGLQVCAVVSCKSPELSSCGTVLNILPTKFTSIRIRGNFSSGLAMQFPTSVLHHYTVLSESDFSFQRVVSNDYVACEVVLLKKASLLTFGIYGRKFNRDGEAATTVRNSGMSLSPFFSLLMILIGFLFNLN